MPRRRAVQSPIPNPQSPPLRPRLPWTAPGGRSPRRRLTAGGDEPIAIGGFEGALRPGENRIGIELTFNASSEGLGIRDWGLDGDTRQPHGKDSSPTPIPNPQSLIPKMPYLLRVAYHSAEADESDACPVRLSARLAGSQVRRGQTVSLRARLLNTTGHDQPTTVAIVGLPAGLEAEPEQLEALRTSRNDRLLRGPPA